MRQKLEELERELFSDYEEASVVGLSESTNFDREWADTIENLLFEDSPVHSPTESTNLRVYSDSTLDYPTIPAIPPQAGKEENSSFLYQTSSSNQEPDSSSTQQEMDLDEDISYII